MTKHFLWKKKGKCVLKTARQWQRQNKLQHGKGLELSPVYLLILTPWGRKWMGSLTWWCHPVRNMTYMHTNACARAMLSHITNRWMECHVTYLKQCRDVSGDDNTEPDWKTLTAWFHERSSGTKHLESQHECLSSSVKKRKRKIGEVKTELCAKFLISCINTYNSSFANLERLTNYTESIALTASTNYI